MFKDLWNVELLNDVSVIQDAFSMINTSLITTSDT